MKKNKLLFATTLCGLTILSYFVFQYPRQKSHLKTAIVFNLESNKHTKDGSPESALRLTSILEKIKQENLWDQVYHLHSRRATETEIALVHDQQYIRSIAESQQSEKTYMNSDKWSPYNSPYAFESSLSAAGSLIDLSEAVARNEFQNGFAIIRPPGHHSLKNKAMGYCIFNNIAIASQNLLKKGLAHRILIFDIDAHHGNGIEDIFTGSKEVFYVSLHQKWMFPYTGDQNLPHSTNISLNFLESQESYLQKFDEVLNKTIEDVKPDLIFVSAGYDTHWRDYMSNLGLSLSGQAEISEKLVKAAAKYSQGRIIFSLEGGYDLEALSNGVSNSIKALLGRNDFKDPIGPAPKN